MLGDALVFPTARSGWQKTFIAGGLLFGVVRFGSVVVYRFVSSGRSTASDSVTVGAVLAALAVICSVIALGGYHVRVLRSGIGVDPGLPSFRPLRGLLRTGVGLCAVVFVWGVVVAVIASLGGFLVGMAVRFPTEGTPQGSVQTFSPVEWGGILAIVAATVVLVYVGMAITVRFAGVGRVRSAFAIRPVLGVAFTSDFFVGCVVWLGITVVFGVIGMVLVSVVIGLFLLFYTGVAGVYALGRGYGTGIAAEQ